MPLLPAYTLLQVYTFTLIGCAYLLLSRPLALLNASPLWLLGESMHVRRASFVPATPNVSNEPLASAPGVTLHSKRSLVESVLGGGVLLSDDIREVLALLGLFMFLAAVTQGILATPLRYSKSALLTLAQKSRSSKHGAYKDNNAVGEFAEKVHTLYTTQTLFMSLSTMRVVFEGGLVAYIYLAYSDRSLRLGADLGIETKHDGLISLLANRIVFALAMADMLFWGYLWTTLREEARDVAEVVARRRKMEEEDGE